MLPLIPNSTRARCVLLLHLEATGRNWPKVTGLTGTEPGRCGSEAYDAVIFLLYYILDARWTTHMTAKV